MGRFKLSTEPTKEDKIYYAEEEASYEQGPGESPEEPLEKAPEPEPETILSIKEWLAKKKYSSYGKASIGTSDKVYYGPTSRK